jgi:hypothetical protein
MTRAMDRGRVLVLIGSVLALIGMALPWVTVGGQADGLPQTSANGFDGAGILVFIGCVGLIALLVLPYASNSGTSGLDRPVSYIALTALAVIGLIIEAVQIVVQFGVQPAFPDKAPGLWLTAAGIFVVCWGVGEVLQERPTTV